MVALETNFSPIQTFIVIFRTSLPTSSHVDHPPKHYTLAYSDIRPFARIMGRVSFVQDTELQQDTQLEEEQSSVFKYQDGPENKSWAGALPLKQGLYDPELEKDACGVGFAA